MIKFELRKDISTPNRYIRAGQQKTKEEWEALFPECLSFGNNEWFIDLSKNTLATDSTPAERKVVNIIFNNAGLHSMSYKDAAVKSIQKYIRDGNIKNALSLLQSEADRIYALPAPKKITEENQKEFDSLASRADYCLIAIGLIEELAGNEPKT